MSKTSAETGYLGTRTCDGVLGDLGCHCCFPTARSAGSSERSWGEHWPICPFSEPAVPACTQCQPVRSPDEYSSQLPIRCRLTTNRFPLMSYLKSSGGTSNISLK